MGEVITMQTTQPLRPVDYAPKQLDLIRRTVAKDCSTDEFDLFIEVARRIGLDPFRKQIYAVVYSKNNADKRKMSIITGIDGFRAVAHRNDNYRPDENEPDYQFDQALKDPVTNPLGLVKATVTVHKQDHQGDWHPIKGVAYWEEFAPLKEIWAYNEAEGRKRPTGEFELDRSGNWARMPRVMLAKCAEAQAIRKGWPEDLSGVYAPEEMAQQEVLDLTASEAAEQHQTETRLRLTNTANTVTIEWRAGEPLEGVPVGQMADRCMEFFRECDSPTQIEAWRKMNQISLKQFWAHSAGDALEVKRAMEKRIAELSEGGSPTPPPVA